MAPPDFDGIAADGFHQLGGRAETLPTVALVGGDLRVVNNSAVTSCEVDTVAAIGASRIHQVQNVQNAACN